MSTARRTSRILIAAAVVLAACEPRNAHLVGPSGADALARYYAIGSDFSMGVQSGGIVYSSQQESWPVLLARAANVTFTLPLFRAPGCTPPLVAPLSLSRSLSGKGATEADTSCAGVLGALTPPGNDLALAGATAWNALQLTPRTITGAPTKYDAGDRARYPAALGSTQSQVTAALVSAPTFLSIDLGLSEVLAAATSGLVVSATSYTQATAWTLVPASVFAPVYAQIADSAKKTGARVLLMTVPSVTSLPSFRRGAELWNERAALATVGVAVQPDCNASQNLVFTPAVVPVLAARALTAGTAQSFSCADRPGVADHILLPAEASTIAAAVDQMNQQIRDLAHQNGWALADVSPAVSAIGGSAGAYSAVAELRCNLPYGAYLSLDGVHPNLTGAQLIADAAATAANTTYGFGLPVVGVPLDLRVPTCP